MIRAHLEASAEDRGGPVIKRRQLDPGSLSRAREALRARGRDGAAGGGGVGLRAARSALVVVDELQPLEVAVAHAGGRGPGLVGGGAPSFGQVASREHVGDPGPLLLNKLIPLWPRKPLEGSHHAIACCVLISYTSWNEQMM